MPKAKKAPELLDGVTESEHYVAVEVDGMTVRQKLEVLEAYHRDHRFVTRLFNDEHEDPGEWSEVVVFEKGREEVASA